MMKYVLTYLVIVNLLAFVLMAADKIKAIHHRWRIPEKVLFGAVIIGGGLGGCAGMVLMHHKTRHLAFQIGFPLILIAQVIGFTIWALS